MDTWPRWGSRGASVTKKTSKWSPRVPKWCPRVTKIKVLGGTVAGFAKQLDLSLSLSIYIYIWHT